VAPSECCRGEPLANTTARLLRQQAGFSQRNAPAVYVVSYTFSLSYARDDGHGRIVGRAEHSNDSFRAYITRNSLKTLARTLGPRSQSFFMCCPRSDAVCRSAVPRTQQLMRCPPKEQIDPCWVTRCDQLKLHALRSIPDGKQVLFAETDMIWARSPEALINAPRCDMTVYLLPIGLSIEGGRRRAPKVIPPPGHALVDHVNTGIIAVRNSERARALFREWIRLTGGRTPSARSWKWCPGGQNQRVLSTLLNLTTLPTDGTPTTLRDATKPYAGLRVCSRPYFEHLSPFHDFCSPPSRAGPRPVVVHLKGADNVRQVAPFAEHALTCTSGLQADARTAASPREVRVAGGHVMGHVRSTGAPASGGMTRSPLLREARCSWSPNCVACCASLFSRMPRSGGAGGSHGGPAVGRTRLSTRMGSHGLARF
jgi:hypothetical protein